MMNLSESLNAVVERGRVREIIQTLGGASWPALRLVCVAGGLSR